VSVAAVADWKVSNASKQKIKKADGKAPLLKLEQARKLLAHVAGMLQKAKR